MWNQKIDWKKKLTSRKLWVAIASFVGMMVVAFGAAEETATQITSLIMAGASMIAYIIGEGMIDAQGVGGGVLEGAEVVDADQIDLK